jgi:hypothetical protein
VLLWSNLVPQEPAPIPSMSPIFDSICLFLPELSEASADTLPVFLALVSPEIELFLH